MKIFGIEFKFNGFDVWHQGNFDPATKSDTNHSHDNRYYTESEVDSKLSNFSQLTIDGYKLIDIFSNNPEVGGVNPIWYALRKGKQIYTDEEFTSGNNSVCVYNNLGGAGVTHTRVDKPDAPNNSKKAIEIVHNGSPTSPGYGGFYQTISSKANAIFVQIFKAKLPSGYAFNLASNPQGSNSVDYWLSNNSGTGKWETYARVVICGNTGTFSSGGHVYVTGSPAPTAEAPLIWYLASCTLFELTNLSIGHGSNIIADMLDDKHASDFASAMHTHTKSQITDMPTKLSEFINDIGAGSGVKITTSSTAPTSPSPGDFWYMEI